MSDSMFCATCLEEFAPSSLTVSPDDFMQRCFACENKRTKALPASDGASLGERLHARALSHCIGTMSWKIFEPKVKRCWEAFAQSLEDEKLTDKDVLELGGGEIVKSMANIQGRKFERRQIVSVLTRMAAQMGALCPWSQDAAFIAHMARFIDERGHFKGQWATGNSDPPEFQD